MSDKRPLIGITPSKNDEGEYVSKGCCTGLERLGADMLVFSRATDLDRVDEMIDQLDGLLIPGGVDVNPARYGAALEPGCGSIEDVLDALQLKMIRRAIQRRLPIFGICRGCQVINVALGGTLTQDIPTRYSTLHQMPKEHPSPFYHDVQVVPETMLWQIAGERLSVNSYHHQSIDRLADGLVASAYAAEGFVEAFESAEDLGCFIMAVQWHPELTLDDDTCSYRLFERFDRAVRESMQ